MLDRAWRAVNIRTGDYGKLKPTMGRNMSTPDRRRGILMHSHEVRMRSCGTTRHCHHRSQGQGQG